MEPKKNYRTQYFWLKKGMRITERLKKEIQSHNGYQVLWVKPQKFNNTRLAHFLNSFK